MTEILRVSVTLIFAEGLRYVGHTDLGREVEFDSTVPLVHGQRVDVAVSPRAPFGWVHDPFLIAGPALISFSGGRTSAYMLWRILQAHGGVLPPGVVVAFANTGKEREETLRFVHECGSRWGVRIRWVEWRDLSLAYLRKDMAVEESFEEVGYNSASRNGEPFAALIHKRQFLPNAVTRYCTQELKVRTMKALALSIGFTHWQNVIGLRYDEGHRVLKRLSANEKGKERWTSVMPLSTARITRRDVDAFWREQPFDLGLRAYEGNCDLCFLKARAKLKAVIREQPGSADWWAEQEAAVSMTGSRATPAGARFVTEYTYAQLAREVAEQPHLFDALEDDNEHDAECGLWCAGEAA